jgi:hypothetical protein
MTVEEIKDRMANIEGAQVTASAVSIATERLCPWRVIMRVKDGEIRVRSVSIQCTVAIKPEAADIIINQWPATWEYIEGICADACDGEERWEVTKVIKRG